VGGLNNGWAVTNTTLGFERGQSATTGYRRFQEEWNQMVAEAKANGAIDDPVVRQRLAHYFTKIQIIRINGLRTLTAAHTGRKDPSIGALGATNKMLWSEMHKEAMELALDIFGAQAMLADAGPASGSWPAALRGQGKAGYKVSPMVSTFFFSRSETIWGGTSQIQRNIVGERVLGLPKEPKVDKAKA
jgi:alkylation response protein AidB-like acyl-CoA dehydrogenase